MSIILNDQQVAAFKNHFNNMPTLYGRALIDAFEKLELEQAQQKAQAEVSAKIAQAQAEAEIAAKKESEEKVETFKKEQIDKELVKITLPIAGSKYIKEKPAKSKSKKHA